MEDDGYRRPEFWLSDGWAVVNSEAWEAPLYWQRDPDRPDRWLQHTLGGARPVDPDEPVVHVSYYEADAFAHWTGMRLPTEAEWETVAAELGQGDNFLPKDFSCEARPAARAPHPRPAVGSNALFGDVWEWTSSAYAAYPGFRAAAGRRRRVQRQVHGQPVRPPGWLLRHTGRARSPHVPELLPARFPLALHRAPPGQGPLTHALHRRHPPLPRGRARQHEG